VLGKLIEFLLVVGLLGFGGFLIVRMIYDKWFNKNKEDLEELQAIRDEIKQLIKETKN